MKMDSYVFNLNYKLSNDVVTMYHLGMEREGGCECPVWWGGGGVCDTYMYMLIW